LILNKAGHAARCLLEAMATHGNSRPPPNDQQIGPIFTESLAWSLRTSVPARGNSYLQLQIRVVDIEITIPQLGGQLKHSGIVQPFHLGQNMRAVPLKIRDASGLSCRIALPAQLQRPAARLIAYDLPQRFDLAIEGADLG
jgi:hypothetical protein